MRSHSRAAAAVCGSVRLAKAKSGRGNGGLARGSPARTSAPACASPSMTAALTPAASMSFFFGQTSPSCSTASALRRASVRRIRASPANRKPQRGSSASNTSRALIIICKTMPLGASV